MVRELEMSHSCHRHTYAYDRKSELLGIYVSAFRLRLKTEPKIICHITERRLVRMQFLYIIPVPSLSGNNHIASFLSLCIG